MLRNFLLVSALIWVILTAVVGWQLHKAYKSWVLTLFSPLIVGLAQLMVFGSLAAGVVVFGGAWKMDSFMGVVGELYNDPSKLLPHLIEYAGDGVVNSAINSVIGK